MREGIAAHNTHCHNSKEIISQLIRLGSNMIREILSSNQANQRKINVQYSIQKRFRNCIERVSPPSQLSLFGNEKENSSKHAIDSINLQFAHRMWLQLKRWRIEPNRMSVHRRIEWKTKIGRAKRLKRNFGNKTEDERIKINDCRSND